MSTFRTQWIVSYKKWCEFVQMIETQIPGLVHQCENGSHRLSLYEQFDSGLCIQIFLLIYDVFVEPHTCYT